MHRKRLKKQPVPQLQWLEDCLEGILKTLAQIIRSLVPGRR
jgi:hypothetical protein